MARLTRAQREWRPGQVKKPSSVRMMFASTVLVLEALVVFFATLAFFGLSVFHAGAGLKTAVMIGGLIFAAAFVALCALLRRPWGYAAGWVLQVLLVATGFLVPAMFFIGACFLACWWYSMVVGARLDREKAERFEAEQEWERTHGRA
ncbi:DUF4233 domain-containing protein [Rothia kristinae]|uniref:DUF4233 domain-containing protein n=1 Tax=Rothia kristinae TaxID=37923 RepID=A0A1S2MZ65_9MICC|nr:DUF4233 domain-containing protein [Rothia kristinae]MBE8526650.1 DUF4233 domain-containing protein [Amycolatopsis sp. H6(2020)]OIJ35654.1 hypothetical protein BK826_06305 [Rothia kristinae]QQC59490.1 DUF4233 domain-containing protein [Rothia kristinae]WGH10277.1 DUF4233 domain-containing protein [Rothia kristinae]